MEEIRNRLKGLLKWSDRLGSDEIYEIEAIIELINETGLIID